MFEHPFGILWENNGIFFKKSLGVMIRDGFSMKLKFIFWEIVEEKNCDLEAKIILKVIPAALEYNVYFYFKLTSTLTIWT